MSKPDTSYDPRSVSRHLYDNAKWWNGFAKTLLGASFIAGTLGVLGVVEGSVIPFVVAGVALLAEVAGYAARLRYTSAEWLQRKLDMRDSFGWEVSGREWTDFLARCPMSVKKKAGKSPQDGSFFASKAEPGATKALHNLLESCWWSKHLCETMYKVYFTVVIIAVFGSIVALIASLQLAPLTDPSGKPSREMLSIVANIVTSVLMLVMSLRLIDTAIGFVEFCHKAELCEKDAGFALGQGSADPVAAIRLWHEYQVARSTAPIMPTWVWKWRRAELNALWGQQTQG